VDFVVCLGGDGVILHASGLFSGHIPPVRCAAMSTTPCVGWRLHWGPSQPTYRGVVECWGAREEDIDGHE